MGDTATHVTNVIVAVGDPWSRSIDSVDVGSTDADTHHLHKDNEEVPNPAEVPNP